MSKLTKDISDSGYNFTENPNNAQLLMKKLETKITNIFDPGIKLFLTLYSLLDKITWEYSTSKMNENQNLTILNKNPTMSVYLKSFLKTYRTKNNKFNYWVIKNINVETEIIELEQEWTILKKKYEKHADLFAVIILHNDLEHGLIPDDLNKIYLIFGIQSLIGFLMLLINSFEKF